MSESKDPVPLSHFSDPLPGAPVFALWDSSAFSSALACAGVNPASVIIFINLGSFATPLL